MKYKMLLFFILILLLFTSCEKEVEMHVLEAENKSIVYLFYSDTVCSIELDNYIIDSYRTYSKTEGRVSFASLFNAKCVNYALVDDEAFSQREYYISLVKEVMKQELLVSLKLNARYLEDTEFVETLGRISSPFKESLFLKELKKVKNTYEYKLGDIIVPSLTWTENIEFITLWLEKILRK